MVSSIGFQLQRNDLIHGFGVRRVHHPAPRRYVRHQGHGVLRKLTGFVARPLLRYGANRIADLISGGSYRIAGTGQHKRRPRRTLGGARHRVIRRVAHRQPHITYVNVPIGHTTIRRPGRPRRPRTTLSGLGYHRRRVAHRRRLVLI